MNNYDKVTKAGMIIVLGSQAVGSRRGRYGSFGVNQNFSYEYKIYVHKNDYDKAVGLIT